MLNVYHAILVSKLIYDLETLQLTNNLANMLDAFQQKGLRRILGIPPTYIDRYWTNARVFERAEATIHAALPPGKTPVEIKTISEIVTARKERLLGHVIRCHENNFTDPLFQVTFQSGDLDRYVPFKRRMGKPRQKWLTTGMETAWFKHDDYDGGPFTDSRDQRLTLRNVADNRQYPFDTRPTRVR